MLYSCNSNDDNTNQFTEYTQNEVNEYDEAALNVVLDTYCFSTLGNIKVAESETEKANPLKKYATKLPSGVWIVKNPEVKNTEETIDLNKKLTIHNNTFYFRSVKKDDGTITHGTIVPEINFSTINYFGEPKTNPYFIKSTLLNTGDSKSDYEIEGLAEGLKEFKMTEKNPEQLYNLQGVVLVPSKLAYARDAHYYLPSSTTTKTTGFKDCCFIFNFEVLKME